MPRWKSAANERVSCLPRIVQPLMLPDVLASRVRSLTAGKMPGIKVATHRLARVKKKTRQQRRTIVFIHESGLSTRPTRARTWALRGQTPVLHETFNWKSLSIIGGLALWRFYFQIHAGSIKSVRVLFGSST